MSGGDVWRQGYALLEARVRSLPALLRAALSAPLPALPWDPARVRRVVTTGVGSSATNARVLATLLQEIGLAARFVPLTSFVAGAPRTAGADALVVFSQGLSPNARLALHELEAWAGVVLVTAVPPPADDAEVAGGDGPPSGALAARQAMLASLAARGVVVQRIAAAEEYGTLLRVAGPMLGHAAALAVAQASARAAGRTATGLLPATVDVDEVCARVADAPARLAREHADLGADAFEAGCSFLASGTYVELLGNLRAKVVEGLLLPEPAVWDLLDFAHGPFQQVHARPWTLFALTRAGAPGEAELLDRLESMLVAGRQRLVHWHSPLPGVLALLEHEALGNALVLRAIAERRVDQVGFPGRGEDRPLYDVAALTGAAALQGGASSDAARVGAIAVGPVGSAAGRTLEWLTWPDVEALLAAGCTSALLPLGSTEQHGPHLPFATDTVIAEAVAERVATRLDGVLRLPVLPLGCASEHLSFPGTLSLSAATLEAILLDLARALGRHGFVRLLVFTAHGGNYDVLRAAAERVAPAVLPLRLEPFLDFARLTATLETVAAAGGVGADEAGQHAGEIETSILLARAPSSVRRARLARGLTDVTLAPQELFYPDLRRHAPDGTVGDPRGARAARADAYLEAWAELLVEAWSPVASDAKKRK